MSSLRSLLARRDPLRWALLLSFAVHLVLGTFFSPPGADRGERPPAPIELVPVPPASAGTGARARSATARSARVRHAPGRGSGRGVRPATPELSLSDLGIGAAGKMPEGPRFDDAEVGGESGALAQVARAVPFEEIFSRIDQALVYPGELQEHHIDGTVKARLVFSETGALDRHRTLVTSASRYLKVLVWMTLRHALSEKLPETYLHGKGMTLYAVFQFEGPSPAGPAVQGNRLAFYRASEHAPGSWKIGPVSGWGIVPQVAIDPQWFVDEVKGLTSRRAEIDPLERYRRDPEW